MVAQESPSSRPSPSASHVREHLANERTFLAWVRTSLGLIGLGFVLARMGLFLRQLALLGANNRVQHLHAGQEFLIIGVVVLVLGTALCGWAGRLYQRTCQAIDEDHYIPARGTALALATAGVAGGLIIVGLVLWSTLAQE